MSYKYDEKLTQCPIYTTENSGCHSQQNFLHPMADLKAAAH